MSTLFTYLYLALMFIFFATNISSQQIFSEDFESGSASPDWEIYFENEDSLSAIDMASGPEPLATGGNYIGYLQDIDGSNTGAALAIAGTTDLYDYSIEADVYCIVYYYTGLSAYTGIVVYADSTIGTYIKMVADFDTDQRIRLYNNHLNTTTFEYTFSHDFTDADIPGGIPAIDGWHKMKIEVRTINSDTTAFWCYFDGELLIGCPIYDTGDDRMDSGQFGLFSFQQDDDGIEGFYDNIVVTSLTTSVEENQNVTVDNYSLRQNYPNPFNPSTTIEFSIPENHLVTLSVNNLLGEQVSLLVNEYLPAGNYKTNWNAENFPSGVYIYTLSADGFIISNKMILMK